MSARESKDLIVPVILAGGSGTRLWPVSRPSLPKHLQAFVGERTLFQSTLLRVKDCGRFAFPIIVGAASQKDLLQAQAREVGVEDAIFISEPCSKNTAAAITTAAMVVSQLGHGEQILVLPSDHVIRSDHGFLLTVDLASDVAGRCQMIVTFGMHPTSPKTGYGYIRRGAPLWVRGAFLVDEFTEKPDAKTAERFLTDGSYTWNSGMFLMPVGVLLSEMEVLCGALTAGCCEALARAAISDFEVIPHAESYAMLESISIDYALMEKTGLISVVPSTFGWTDLGSWEAVWEESARDEHRNAINGDVALHGAKNCYVRSENRLTTLVGVEDLVVVTTDDAVLVASSSASEDVKGLVEILESEGRAEARQHNGEVRPWGRFARIDAGPGFQVKRITVDPGGKLSLQYHKHRAEHWTVVSGVAAVTVGADELTLEANQSVHIPLGEVHRLENRGDEPLELIEVQCGDYLGEDDIIRLEDTYGRGNPREMRAAELAS